jgi:hypothetical protein
MPRRSTRSVAENPPREAAAGGGAASATGKIDDARERLGAVSARETTLSQSLEQRLRELREVREVDFDAVGYAIGANMGNMVGNVSGLAVRLVIGDFVGEFLGEFAAETAGELQEAVRHLTAERETVRAEMALIENELDALINAPVSGGRDPFEWLPDELVVMVMLVVPFEVLWGGVCSRVCKRWARLLESAPVQRRKRDGRWAAYKAGVITPRELKGHTKSVNAIVVGLDGKVYSGSNDCTVRVWSGDSLAHVHTLVGHIYPVSALAVGLDGKIYSGSVDKTIRVWSGVDGTHLHTLVGHARAVVALAVGLDGKIFSGSHDKTIRVWSGADGTHLQDLEGHNDFVNVLAVGLDGKVYSGSDDARIRVWSGHSLERLHSLVGHTRFVTALTVGLDGKVYSGSFDQTIRVWSDGTLLHTFEVGKGISVVGVAALNGVLVAGVFGSIRVLSRDNGAPLHTLDLPTSMIFIRSCFFRCDGSMLSGSDGNDHNMLVW